MPLTPAQLLALLSLNCLAVRDKNLKDARQRTYSNQSIYEQEPLASYFGNKPDKDKSASTSYLMSVLDKNKFAKKIGHGIWSITDQGIQTANQSQNIGRSGQINTGNCGPRKRNIAPSLIGLEKGASFQSPNHPTQTPDALLSSAHRANKGNDYCSECIQLCNQGKLNLTARRQSLGAILKNEGLDTLRFAPAGNHQNDPKVIICGLATSDEALNYMIKPNGNSIQACLESVYRGPMAVNLALMLNALGITTKWLMNNNNDLVNMRINNNPNGLSSVGRNCFGNNGCFIDVPESLMLTQATCCYTRNSNSTWQNEWWKDSSECREKGFLHNLVKRFVVSDNSRLLIFLGMQQAHGHNKNLTEIAVPLVQGHRDFAVRELGQVYNQVAGDPKKLICAIHHPANAAHIYNNQQNIRFSSILYSYFAKNNWAFGVNNYANIGRVTMERARNYYRDLCTTIAQLPN